ncbi:MAG: alpha/beta hydrolase [Fuerstiella sp.]
MKFVWLLLFTFSSPVLLAQAENDARPRRGDLSKEPVIQTFGGRQFWGDVRFLQGWRIQHNVLFGQYRLLDPNDRRYLTGTLEECTDRLNQIRDEQHLRPMTGKAAVLIHGIGRSSKCFRAMGKALREDGYTVVPFEYPSTRVTIEESADYLHQVLQSMPQIESVDLVCHSMGGLLLRTYLQKHGDDRFRRAVLLGVPNHGAEMADFLKRNSLFKAILGPAGQQLVTDDDGLIAKLPAPDFPFAVIAGGRSAEKGFNPILPGDNDSTVTVASTRLAGASDFLLVPVIHSFLMTNADCIQATRCFLKSGQLCEDRDACPIETCEQESVHDTP